MSDAPSRTGVWEDVDDDGVERSTVVSMAAPSTAWMIAGSTSPAQTTRSRDYCYGEDGCPWCRLGLPAEHHGKIEKAVAAYSNINLGAAQAVALGLAERSSHLICLSTKALLVAAVATVMDGEPTQADRALVSTLVGQGLLPAPPWLGIMSLFHVPVPPEVQREGVATAAAAAGADDAPAADASETAPKRSRGRRKGRGQWAWLYEEPMDAKWRTEMEWIPPEDNRERAIDIWLDGTEWTPVSGWLLGELLHWYDSVSEPGSWLRNIPANPDTTNVYDFCYQGGPYITQHRVSRRDDEYSKPRPVKVRYAASADQLQAREAAAAL